MRGTIMMGCAGALLLGIAAAQAQTLKIATDQSPVGLDPHVATAFATQVIDSNIYEGLTAIDPDLHSVPALAQSWTVSQDGTTYVFRLRRGATFHDGKALTPQDVLASLARVRDPKTGSPFASRFAMVASAEADGADGVKIVLSSPSASFLAQLASLAIVPEGAADLARHPDGTGPFKFREWVPNASISLEKNPSYWQAGLPFLSGLEFSIVPEAATREIGLRGGTYQFLPVVDAATATELKAGGGGIQIQAAQDLAYSLIGMNAAVPPFDKPEVREALNTAIDRALIVKAAYFGYGTPAGPLSPALKDWALPPDFPCYVPDPERAKALLVKAGLTPPVKVTMNVLGSIPLVVDIAQIVQAQAAKAGFDITLNVQEAGKFIQDWRAGNFQAFASLNSGGPDPDDYFGRTFQTGGATNVYKYSNPDLDKLLTAARASTDPAARRKMYDEAQRMLACTGPVAHLVYGTLFAAMRADVQGYRISPTRSLWPLRETRLAQ
ncbi:MAG: ABC transporter substrate-binding protein [Proteobacteria bacterium]|nr:ABC transporter substrate-binding protein [Pseudomonadota bacterium]